MDEAPFIAEEERMMRQYRKAAADAERAAGPFRVTWLSVAAGVAVAALMSYGLIDAEIQARAETTRYKAYMRECVPTQPERRCDEIWWWVKR